MRVRIALLVGMLGMGIGMGAWGQNRSRLPVTTIPTGLGVNIHFTDAPAAEVNLIRSAGFRLIRMDLFWAQVERRRGVYDFSAYDRLVRELTRRSMKPLFILDYGNPLYDSPEGETLSPRTPEGWEAYARFCAAAAARYRGRGVIWELWNEPNGFWKPAPNADHYASMALAAAKAMRTADPNCAIVAPGVSGFDFPFLEHVFRRGLLQYLDAVTVHPYRDSPPETALPEFARLRQLIDRYALPGQRVPFACSEWGYSAAAVSEGQQGQYLVRQWLTNMMAGSEFSIWYDWKNDGADPKEKEHHFGTVRPDLQQKPAYQAARAMTRALSGYRFQKRLELGRPEDFVMLFTRGEQQALVVWTAGSPDDLFLPRGTGVQRATDWLGESMTVTPGPAGIRVPLGPAPYYLMLRPGSEELALRAAWRAELESTSIDGGARGGVRLQLTVRNPTSRPLPIAARVAAPPLLEGAWATPVPPALAAKESRTLQWVGTWGLRADQEVTVPVHVRIGRIAERESVRFEVRNALRPELRWREDGADLVVHNRSGAPFAGEARLGEETDALRQPVRLASGETSTVVALEGMPGEQINGGLYDVRGQFLAPLAIKRRQLIPVEPGQSWEIHADGGPAVMPRIVKAEVVPAPGDDAPFPHAVRCDFDLGGGWKFFRVAVDPQPALDAEPQRLGMWVYGDGGGGTVRCRFVDSRGQTFQPLAAEPVTWEGWRWVSMPLDGRGAGFWGGPADGVVRGPLQWDSLFLFDPGGEAPRRGTLYFTGLTVEY